MRRQNPPQAHIAKAEQIEKYLHPAIIGCVYAGLGVFYALLVSAIFGALFHGSVLKNSPLTVAIFAAVVVVPAMLAFAGFFFRPRDPLSRSLTSIAQTWRRPLELRVEECTFTEWLVGGESVRVKALFYYPAVSHTDEVKQRIYSYGRSALMRDCSLRESAPSRAEAEAAFDAALEMVAKECGVPILYSEVWEISQISSNVELAEGSLLEASA